MSGVPGTIMSRMARRVSRTVGHLGWGDHSRLTEVDRSADEQKNGGDAPSLDTYRSYERHARHIGLDDIVLFLSFDCDTDLDPAASLEVMAFLDSLGIKATFAVPGVQLEHGADAYQKIAARGSEFMNHGHRPHAEWQDDRYVGITFYETMALETVEADIREADETVRRVIGKPPLGFRAPHFGHFQKPEQLAFVHRLACELGYHYCSTTIPSFGLAVGPAHVVEGVVELPTFGSTYAPTTILDSWTYLSDRRDYALSEDYGDLFIRTVDELRAVGMPALLTWYVDPCHVVGQEPFERAMRHLEGLNVQSLSGAEAAALARSF